MIFRNARILDASTKLDLTRGDLWIENGKVRAIEPAGVIPKPAGVPEKDCSGHWIIPGLIDAHAHLGWQVVKTGEIGKETYAFLVASQVRVDKDDNIWVVDQMSNTVMKFDPDGRVSMLLGRKSESENVPVRGAAPPPAPGGGPAGGAARAGGREFRHAHPHPRRRGRVSPARWCAANLAAEHLRARLAGIPRL